MIESSKSALWPSLLRVFLKYSTLLLVTQRRSDWDHACADALIPEPLQVLSVFVPGAPSRESQSCLFFTPHNVSDCFCVGYRRLHRISLLAVHHTMMHEMHSPKVLSKVQRLLLIITLVLLGRSTRFKNW